ncbi:MAG: CpsD/CapB family tyrosine-protein kinase, partial [Thermodesulfobacteriota bacterium]
DGNVRHPTIHRFFKTEPEPGLLDILTGKLPWEKALRKSDRVNFYVLPSGSPAASPLFWLGSERMAELLALLKSEFEFVVIDAPPLLESAETELFLPWMEASVLVIKARRTGRETARRAVTRLQGYKNFLGAVLNR